MSSMDTRCKRSRKLCKGGLCSQLLFVAAWKAVVAISGDDTKKSVRREALNPERQVRINDTV